MKYSNKRSPVASYYAVVKEIAERTGRAAREVETALEQTSASPIVHGSNAMNGVVDLMPPVEWGGKSNWAYEEAQKLLKMEGLFFCVSQLSSF